MIYLIESNDKLKIGYAKNVQKRFKTYRTHNIDAHLLAYKDGVRKDEKLLHELCKEFKYEGEWFYNNDFVKDTFNNYTTTIITDFPKVKEFITLFANFIKEQNNSNGNYFEWMGIQTNYNEKYREEIKFVEDYFFQLREQENLDDEIELYQKYYKEQFNFWKYMTNIRSGVGRFNIIENIVVTITPKQKPKKVDLSLWLRNNQVLINHFPIDDRMKRHLLEAQTIIEENIQEMKNEISTYEGRMSKYEEMYEYFQQLKQGD